MALDIDKLKTDLPLLSNKLAQQIANDASIQKIPAGETILSEGQYVKVIPIVLNGLLKVFTRHEGKELLLYYIRPKESCIMSFAAVLGNEPSKILAETEEDTEVLLLPFEKVKEWTHQFNDLNDLFFRQYNLRYSELLSTIQALLFNKMDERLQSYLVEKVKLTGHNPLKMSHREIANELGTAREVVSRVIKKLEAEGLVTQNEKGILLNDV